MGISSMLESVPRKWRTPKLMYALFAIELPLCVATLALFGIAQPDLYRTRFWQFGADQGWNSNPNQLIYAFANYKPISSPLPWSQLFVLHAVIFDPKILRANTRQHHKFQRGHFRPLSVHASLQSRYVHHWRLPPSNFAHCALWTRGRLGRLHPQPSWTRHE